MNVIREGGLKRGSDELVLWSDDSGGYDASTDYNFLLLISNSSNETRSHFDGKSLVIFNH